MFTSRLQSYKFKCSHECFGGTKLTYAFLIGVCVLFSLFIDKTGESSESVIFKDAQLQLIVKNSVNANGRIFCHQSLKDITILRANHRDISDIEGLQLLTNLVLLDLSENNINDLTPLSNLVKLECLFLNGNKIETVEPLKNLLGLRKLDLSHNDIKNIDSLYSLDHLERLDLRHNLISNIKTFRQLKKIPGELYLHGNPIVATIPVEQYYKEIRLTGLNPSLHGYNSHQQLFINEIMASASNLVINEKHTSSDWIEIYNAGKEPVNLKGFGLSDKINHPFRWKFPPVLIAPAGHLLIWASGNWDISHNNNLHTNFKIKRNGEPILLTDPSGNVVDAIRVPPSHRNISFGRRIDGNHEWIYFRNPTPSSSNDQLYFSHEAGFYSDTLLLKLRSFINNAKIYYSLDGSTPNENSIIYQEPITISSKKMEDHIFAKISNTSMDWAPVDDDIFKGTVVRARQFIDGKPFGPIITKTYFIDPAIYQKYSFPIVSLVTDPQNLFDFSKGIYVLGKQFTSYVSENPDHTKGVKKKLVEGNYSLRGTEWERPVHIEFFEPNGFLGISQNAGVRIFGGNYNRKLAQKPMILYARKQYDQRTYFSYEFFPGLVKSKHNQTILRKFKHLVLRTSGQDYNKSMFADALMQDIIGTKFDVQAYRPVIVFLNGEYWGIYNLREHIDEHHLETRYDIPKEQIALLENYIEVKYGNESHRREFAELLNFLRRKPLSNQNNYSYISECIDINNYLDYSIFQIYFNNKDWPVNNIRYWKRHPTEVENGKGYGDDGKWRWLIYDTDFGFGISGGLRAFKYNMVKKATEAGQRAWPNPDRSTLILRSLLENEEFKVAFISRFADYLNTIFKKEVVNEKIGKFEKILARELSEHISRWGGSTRSIQSINKWRKWINQLIDFGNKRPRWIRKHLIEHFGLSGLASVTLRMTPPKGGYIKINTVTIDKSSCPWEGIYFKDVPIQISAFPHEGYRFSGWEGGKNTGLNDLKIKLDSDQILTASFEELHK